MSTERKRKSPREPSFKEWFPKALCALFDSNKQPGNVDEAADVLLAQLPAHLLKHRSDLTRVAIFKGLDTHYWEGKANHLRRQLLEDSVAAGISAEKVHEDFVTFPPDDDLIPPLWVVEERFAREKRGRASAPRHHAKISRGFLELSLDEAPTKFSVERTRYSEPFRALPKHKEGPLNIWVLSAVQLGLPYAEDDIIRNLTRSAFSAARKDGADAIILGGGTLRLEWQKTAGPARLVRDLASAEQIDLEALAKSYQPEARQILDADPATDPLFVTAAERFEEPVRAWFKVTHQPDHKGFEFNGPVYIIPGPNEFRLAEQITYGIIGAKQMRRFLQAQAMASIKATRLSHADELLTEAHQSGKGIKKAEAAYKAAKKDFDDAVDEKNRFRMTNTAAAQNKKLRARVLAYIFKRLEESIPNSKVVGLKRAFMTFGGDERVYKFISGGDSPNPHYDELRNYGPNQRKRTLPALTVSMHPRAVYMRKTVREDYNEGKMLTEPVGFVEAPMLVDRDPILDAAQENRIPLPVMSAVRDARFNAGVLKIRIDPRFGISPNVIDAEAVRKLGAPQRGRPRSPAKSVYLLGSTDMHFGGSNRFYLRLPTGVPIGLNEAVFKLMTPYVRKHDGRAPVAAFWAADDQTQGNHFKGHNRPHPQRDSNAAVLNRTDTRLLEIGKNPSRAQREQNYLELIRYQADQIRVRTPDHQGSQFTEVIDGFLTPPECRDVFKGILLKAHSIGMVMRTMSDFTGQYDKRDIGPIVWGSGNHAGKTTDYTVYEGPIFRDILRASLRYDPEILKLGLDVDRGITAPLSQDQTTGYARLKVGESGFEYGIDILGSPPKRDSWYDVLHAWPLVEQQRGNPSTILNGCGLIVHFTGDKHFLAEGYAGDGLYEMGPPATYTDTFANIAGGLPENSAGVVVLRLPVDGPHACEMGAIHLTPNVIQQYLDSGEEFPWEDFLPYSI